MVLGPSAMDAGRPAASPPAAVSPASDQSRVRLLAHHPCRSANVDQSPSLSRHQDGLRPFYGSAQWTSDGTALIVTSSDGQILSFVLPADLLQTAAGNARRLEPQARVKLPEPSSVVVPSPFFSLAEPTSQTYLAACRDHPLQLYQAFPCDEKPVPVASYKLIRAETEEYITPASLIWQLPGSHFLCGSANRLDYFDLTRHGSDGPVLTLPTIPSRRHKSKGGGVGMKGVVSALEASPPAADGSSLVAAGTRTRWMGLYDLGRTDKAVANWSIANAAQAAFGLDLGGQGIAQVIWSPCGRYLIINERHSSGILVYDIRGTGKLLSILGGRTSATQQKLYCDLFQAGPQGGVDFELWAGSDDGSVLVWEQVGTRHGPARPSWHWKAHDAPVGSTALHACGSVLATCSGGWEHSTDDDYRHDDGTQPCPRDRYRTFSESSLKVWSLGAQD